MPIRLSCPRCKAQFSLDESLAGKTMRCTQCGQLFSVPKPKAPEPPAPAEPALAVPTPDVDVPVLTHAEPPEPAVVLERAFQETPVLVVPKLSMPPTSDMPAPFAGDAGQPAPLRQSVDSGKFAILLVLALGGCAAVVVLLLAVVVGGLYLWQQSLVAQAEVEAQGAQQRGDAAKKANLPPLPAKQDDLFKGKEKKGDLPPLPPDRKDWLDRKDNFPPDDGFPPTRPPFPNEKEPGPKPLPPVKLPPANVAPLPITAAALKGERATINLPGTVSRVRLGGGGRFLILHLPRQRQLAVFDVNEAKVVKYLPVAADRIVFAAGNEKLVVAAPEQNVLQRWNLLTLEREVTVNSPFTDALEDLCMGHASHGPVLVTLKDNRSGYMRVLDLMTLREIEFPGLQNSNSRLPGGAAYLHASANGRVFGMRNGVGGEPHTVTCLQLGETASAKEVWGVSGSILAPSPDGRFIYTSSGVYNADMKLLYPQRPQESFAKPFLPAAHGPYFLQLDMKEWDKHGGTLRFFLADNYTPFAQLTDVDGVTNEQIAYGSNRDSLTTTERVHFIPDAKLVVTIPKTNDKLLLYRFDPAEAMDRSGVDYLLVTSSPVTVAIKGKKYYYPMTIKSKKGGVKVKLESAPEGMKLTKRHELVWDVPADQPEGDVTVIATVSDATGQERFHTFTVSVAAKAPQGYTPPKVGTIDPKDFQTEPQKEPLAKQPGTGPAALTIVPPKLTADKLKVPLPDTIDDIAVGGGGRFLLIGQPKTRRIALFDVNEAKVVHYFPVSSDEVRFAAGRTKLVMAFPGTRILQRWDLLTRQRELTVTFPFDHDAHMVLFGSNSEGPVVVGAGGYGSQGKAGLTFLDLKAFKPIKLNLEGADAFDLRFVAGFARVSGDGTVFASWEPNLSPQGLRSFVLTGDNLRSYYAHTSVGHIVPGPDGKFIYTARGIYTNQTKPVGHIGYDIDRYTLPAVEGDFYLEVKPGGDRFDPNRKPNLLVFRVGDNRPLVQAPQIVADLGSSDNAFNSWAREKFGNDKRILFVPSAKLVVTVPFTNDHLLVHRLDLEEALAKSGIDYLFVTSRPPASVQPGEAFRYTVAVKSRRGGVRFRLDIGPAGMKVDEKGVVTWNVPANSDDEEHNVTLTISDGTGQEIFHSFKLNVVRPRRQ